MATDVAWVQDVPLFGGAITCDLPKSFLDASTVRQVPDNQEVWTDETSDISLIVEVLELKEDVRDEDAVAFHLAELGRSNEATEHLLLESRRMEAEEVPGVGAEARRFAGVCEQTVAKFNEAAANRIRVHLCVLRLGAQTTDLLITLNDPIRIDPESSSSATSTAPHSAALFTHVLSSFHIKEWSLFDEPDEQ